MSYEQLNLEWDDYNYDLAGTFLLDKLVLLTPNGYDFVTHVLSKDLQNFMEKYMKKIKSL